MTETSAPWSGTTPGDSGPYTDQDWSTIYSSFWQTSKATQGVLYNRYSGNLAVSNPTDIRMRVRDGVAMVDGTWYRNESDRFLIADSGAPSANPRIDVVALEKDHYAQTVRLVIVEGAEAGSPSAPSMTQTEGITWQIPLAQYQISTAGVISAFTDRRRICTPSSGVLFPIEEVDMYLGGATYTFSNIDTLFKSLFFVLSIDPTYAGGPGERDISLRFNGDSGTNYAYNTTYFATGGATTTAGTGATSIKLADIYPDTSSFGLGGVIVGEVFLPNNSSSSIRVRVDSMYSSFLSTNTSFARVGMASGYYNNGTTKVTSMTVFTDATNFGSVTNASTFYLYGVI